MALLSLSVSAIVVATEYKSPHLALKDASPSAKEMKAANFEDEYKMEGATKTDRQIASEKEDSDRMPSSVSGMKKNKVIEHDTEKTNDDKFEPKPWLFKQTIHDAN
jgi:hypothetical protein